MKEGETEPDLGAIGKYRLVELIGEGAMGKVYRAHDPVLSRAVAIKLMAQSMADDAHLRNRFLREARAAANLQHPNIITIYDFGDANGHPYIAMELVEGTDLAHMIEQQEAHSLDSKLAIVVGLLKGLGYAHAHGVIHRDIKPANIRITRDARVKIMDFGIAHLQGSEITHSGAVLGTPDYMAPEQVRGLPVTAQTDIFAAGAVLYEVLTFQKPFTGDSLHAVLYKVVSEEPMSVRKLNPSLPQNLERIVDTALHKDPGRRYPTAEAMAADLTDARQRLSELETVDTLRFSRPFKLQLPAEKWSKQWWLKWRDRKEVRYATGAALGLVVLVTMLRAVSGNRQPEMLMAKAIVVSDTAPSPPQAVEPAAARVAAAARVPRPATPRPAARPVPIEGRAEVEQAVTRLERAFESRSAAELRRVYPGITAADARMWGEFFRSRSSIDAELRIDDLKVEGASATVKLRVQFTYADSTGRRRQTRASGMSGTVEKTAAGLVWRTLKQQ
ncbi:MAG: serine/threonine protein kinase [Gemmatimonadetes bacterium]|nr:serine/threonine protein kinase [Gemmatimonadota bacterium]